MRADWRTVAVTVIGVIAAAAVTVAAGVHFFRTTHNVPPRGLIVAPRPVHAGLPAEPASYLGVYSQVSPHSYAGVSKLAQAIGRQPNIAVYYSGWREPFQAAFASAARRYKAFPMVEMEPGFASLAAIAGGRYDGYLRAYATKVRQFGSPVILSFGHEMNGDWYTWGYHHTPPATFVAAWRHLHDVFTSEGADNVTWLWTVNVLGGRAVSPVASWWPGDGYVTWIGLVGHYRSATDTFSGVFGPTLTAVRQVSGKPVLIAEVGTEPDAAKAIQIADLFAGVRRSGLLGLAWFDQRKGSNDWRLETGPGAVAAFARAARSYPLLPYAGTAASPPPGPAVSPGH